MESSCPEMGLQESWYLQALGSGPWALGSGPWALGPGLWALGSRPWALGSRLWALEPLGGTWQAAWAPGASWGSERHLLHKLVIFLQFSDILRRDPAFRVAFGGLGVTVYCACAQKLARARRASLGDVAPTLYNTARTPTDESVWGNNTDNPA